MHLRAVTASSAASAVEIDEPTFSGIVKMIWSMRWIVACFMLGGLILGGLLMSAMTPRYTITTILGPNKNDTGRSFTSSSIISTVLGTTRQPDSRFEKFKETMETMAIAQRLFEDERITHALFKSEWNEATKTWRQPAGLWPRIHGLLRTGVGEPAWAPPSPYRLQQMIERLLVLPPDSDDQLASFSINFPDPLLGKYLLSRIVSVTDDVLRDEDRIYEDDFNKFLNIQMKKPLNLSNEAALTQLALESQRTLILLELKEPYSMSIVVPVYASDQPTSPNPAEYLLGGTFVGLILAIAIAWFRYFNALRVAAVRDVAIA